MSSIRTVAIRLQETNRIIVAYTGLLELVNEPKCRKKYQRILGMAQRKAESLRCLQKEKSRFKLSGPSEIRLMTSYHTVPCQSIEGEKQ